MAAFHPLEWHDFFVGTIGAAAALTGLLFVAVSINLDRILKFTRLPGRAACTLGLLLGALVVSGVSLAPGQANRVLGVEILAVGLVVTAQALLVTRGALSDGSRHEDGQTRWVAQHLALILLPCALFVAGGVSLVVGGGGGLYWVLGAVLLTFFVAAVNGWVLLVEINR